MDKVKAKPLTGVRHLGRICPVGDIYELGEGRSLDNGKKLLRLLRDHGPMHRAELARRSGLSRTTVSAVISSLISDGLVGELSEGEAVGEERQPGRPGQLLGLHPGAGSVIGVAFSYHEVRLVVTDILQRPIAELAEPLPTDQGWKEDLAVAVGMIDKALDDAKVCRSGVVGVGLGIPGPLDRRHGVAGASSSTAWLGALPAVELASRLGFPIALDNTARLSLLAEARWGAGAGRSDIVYVKLSSGVGGGFLVDGRLLRGSVGAAGEIGHVSVDPQGRLCRCGGRGCLEAYASLPAVLDALSPVLGPELDIPSVLDLLKAGDRTVARLFSDLGHMVGAAVANAVNLFNPEVVIVGGELAQAGDAILLPVKHAIKRQTLELAGGELDVLSATLGPGSAAMGGVALVLREEDRLVPPSRARAS